MPFYQSDLSLVPDLSLDTPARYDSGPTTGGGAVESGIHGPAPTARAGISIPWILLGGLAIVMLGLRSRR